MLVFVVPFPTALESLFPRFPRYVLRKDLNQDQYHFMLTYLSFLQKKPVELPDDAEPESEEETEVVADDNSNHDNDSDMDDDYI
jgi:hypothetical protein